MSRSHHHQQQSMNEYEAMFMNILLGVIFLFQLSFSLLFPFPALSDFFSSTLIFQFFFLVFFFFFFYLPLSLPFSLAVVCLRTSSPLPQGVTSAHTSYLNLACPKDFWSFTQSVKRTRTLPKSSHSETTVKSVSNLSSFSLFLSLSSYPPLERLGYPLSKSWHPSLYEITTTMETNYAFFTVLFVFHCLKRCCYTLIFLLSLSSTILVT